jgi:hypothetical protein
MMQKTQNSKPIRKPMFKDGKLYFTKETERRVLFFMTLVMLASGAVMKLL